MDSLTGKPVWCHEGMQVLALDRSAAHPSEYVGYEWRIVQVLPDTDIIVIEREDEAGNADRQSIAWIHCAPAHPKNVGLTL